MKTYVVMATNIEPEYILSFDLEKADDIIFLDDRTIEKDADLEIIPAKSHACISHGLLKAWNDKADIVVVLDDDVRCVDPLMEDHCANLLYEDGLTVKSSTKWYNTLRNVVGLEGLYPRGHPYNARGEYYDYKHEGGECVLNMGLWEGQPDLDALTIASNGGLNGRFGQTFGVWYPKIIVGEGNYFPICSMNVAFRREIIPAYYFLYDAGRFDDIWAGLFLKKVADSLGDKICFGRPLVRHEKRPRNVFKDLAAEAEGMWAHEELWKVVDGLEIEGQDYASCYYSLIEELEKKELPNIVMRQIPKMRLWLEKVLCV